MNMKIDINKEDDKTVVLVAGEIDAYTAPKLREALLPLAEEENPQIAVNLKNVSYMDSTSICWFIEKCKKE